MWSRRTVQRAIKDDDSLWAPPKDISLYPSSHLWDEASERRSSETMCVAYGGGVVSIPKAARRFVDSFERTLIGWHGTYDPLCGMDGESMVGLPNRN